MWQVALTYRRVFGRDADIKSEVELPYTAVIGPPTHTGPFVLGSTYTASRTTLLNRLARREVAPVVVQSNDQHQHGRSRGSALQVAACRET
jgi:hypothetical protein